MTRINVVPVEELHRIHLVSEYREIVRVFALARKNQYQLHKKKVPSEYTLGTGHVIYFCDKLQFISDRYDALCAEMVKRGYKCNRVPKEELHKDIRPALFRNYVPTKEAIAINNERINLRLQGIN